MTAKLQPSPTTAGERHRLSVLVPAALVLAVLVASYLRFTELGARSLWFDEFCTWHASQIGLVDSVRWEPELTIPPLYQFVLRATTGSAYPPEWQLRLPAACCGVLLVFAGYWLGKVAASRAVGCAIAALLACNLLQIEYSQEARPYSMLVLGCTVSTVLWYRLVTRPDRLLLALYVGVTVLVFHAHYLAALAIFAQVGWYLMISTGRRANRPGLRPLVGLLIAGIMCVPIVVRSLYFRSSVTQAIGWIKPPSWHDAVVILQDLTFGRPWIIAVLIPSVVFWLVACYRRQRSAHDGRKVGIFRGADDVCGLLLFWLLCAWFGLLAISWFVKPVLVARYALPAAVPALLFPLIIAHRIDRRAPLVVMILFVAGTAPDWLNYGREIEPGFRELTHYLRDYVDPQSEAVVLTLDEVNYPGWADTERLAFEYYPLDDRPIHELPVTVDTSRPQGSILQDPRGLYLIVFRAEPADTIAAAGRQVTRVWHEGESYSQLLFAPYRLLRVAPAVLMENMIISR